MSRFEQITSAQNPKIKLLLSLMEKSRTRREKGLFTVEGAREAAHCIEAGYVPEALFVCPEILTGDSSCDSSGIKAALIDKEAAPLASAMDACNVFCVSREAYSKLAYREGTEGVVAEMKMRSNGLEELALGENPLVAVLEAVEKPGNLGAVLRSADAAGADAVIVCDPLTDIYNPNLIRSSIGAAFTVPTACCTSAEAIAFLKARGIRILTAQLQDSLPYYDTPMTGGTAIVMGTEATGLTPAWREAADAHIMIPMLGRLDSLNVSVSAAILLFEAVRQRQCKTSI